MVFDVKKIMPKQEKTLDFASKKAYTEHYTRVLQEKFGYMRTEANHKAFDVVAEYIAQCHAASKGECDYPRRGLFLFGEPGTGKTTAMQLVSGLCGIDYITTGVLAKTFAMHSYNGFWSCVDEYNHKHLIVDDLGCEETTRSYGNGLPLADFIRERERQWTEEKVCTSFTSNAKSREDVTARYGLNVCSRLLGMCDFIRVEGRDLRPQRKQEK